MSVLIALPWRILRPKVRIAHWCFDLYPEAAIADQLISENGLVAKILTRAMAMAYRQCDLLVDMGSCMKARLSKYHTTNSYKASLPVWAIVEPRAPSVPDETDRQRLFGGAGLALIYSGSLGKAHTYEEVLSLAAKFSPSQARFVFSVTGARTAELAGAVKNAPRNIKVVEFASLQDFERRLAAADIHIVTLRPNWTGIVIPSKFFGSLAIGRPVLFIGSAASTIAQWIEEFKVGWVLDTGSSSGPGQQMQVTRIVEELSKLVDDPDRLGRLFIHCHSVYQQNFAKERTLDLWHQRLSIQTPLAEPVAKLAERPLPENQSSQD